MPAPRPSLPPAHVARRAARGLVAATALLALLLAVGACGGGGSSSSGASTAGPGSGRGFFAQDPKVRSCLQKQGVTLPAGPAGGRRFRGNVGGATGTTAQPPPAADARPRTSPNGQRPPGAGGRPGGFRRDPARFAKLQAALKKCGMNPPAGGRRGTPPGSAPTSTTAS